MPITSIWPIKGSYVQALSYIANPMKTEAKDGIVSELEDVLDYVSNGEKTNQKYYVTGINCDPDSAAESFRKTKIAFGKPDGVLAFHAIQSFKPGEVDATTAHRIGTELAAKMWGDRFEVVVCTHLDKAHPHNHFVVNSVSWTDGRKFDNSRKDYVRFSSLSDDLARQYGLSIIETPKGKSRHYAEWKADHEYKPTVRTMIKEDIDHVISGSESFKEFTINLKKLGYEIKFGKHLAVKAPGGKRFIRLYKLSSIEDYSEEAIREKILANSVVHFQPFHFPEMPEIVTISGQTKETKKLKGFQALYVKYMFMMGIIPQQSSRNKQVPFSMKQDLRYLDKITEEVTYLFKNDVTTAEELAEHINILQQTKDNLELQRKRLSNHDNPSEANKSTDYEPILKSLKTIRKELRLCNDINKRIFELNENINGYEKNEHKVLLKSTINR
ncbi:MAG: relaxase/mobilization nuclease domain-containing protein [Solobacterium sp.]|nr:relaxase/mobilization nuclease domain-containing protein [Solobacterium sp.]